MAKPSLSRMSVDELLKLRDDLGKMLDEKVDQLRADLSRLGMAVRGRGRRSVRSGRKVPVKYRDRSGNTWAGRGAQPLWLREKLKAGAKLEDFAVDKKTASKKSSRKTSRKTSRKKPKKTRTAKPRPLRSAARQHGNSSAEEKTTA